MEIDDWDIHWMRLLAGIPATALAATVGSSVVDIMQFLVGAPGEWSLLNIPILAVSMYLAGLFALAPLELLLLRLKRTPTEKGGNNDLRR